MSKEFDLLKLFMEMLSEIDDEAQTDKTQSLDLSAPHLECLGRFYGLIGAETKIKDMNGETLHIGDVVYIINNGKHKDLPSDVTMCSETFIVNDDNKNFVMGIENCCDENGNVKGFTVIKKKSYTELENHETHSRVTAFNVSNDD